MIKKGWYKNLESGLATKNLERPFRISILFYHKILTNQIFPLYYFRNLISFTPMLLQLTYKTEGHF